jgi:gliding motility-associated-like protein
MRLFKIVLSLLVWIFSIDASSQQINWALSAGSFNPDQGNTVARDAAGNVYVAGKFGGSTVDFDPSPATATLTNAGSTDGYVAKYNAAGQYQWAFRIGGNNLDEVHGIAVDQATGDFYITGYFRGAAIDFDPGAGTANLTSNGDAGADPGYGGDIFLAKYTSNGAYLWAFNIGSGDLYDAGIGISLDGTGNVYIGGYYTNTADFDPGPGTANLTSQANGPIFLAKYTATGAYQWAIGLGSTVTNNSIFDIKTDPAGNVYTVGYYQGTNIDFDPGPGVAPLSSNGGYEMFLAKYSATGQYQFAISMGGPNWDVLRGLALDNNNNVYVIGDFRGTVDFDPGPGIANVTANGAQDAVVAKYTSTGQYVWAVGFGGVPDEWGSKVIVDGAHIFVSGAFSGVADMDPTTEIENLTSNGGLDIYIGKYSLDGEYICAMRVGGVFDDGGHALVSNGPNEFYLTGYFAGNNVDFDPGTPTSNLSSNGGADMFLAKYTWPDNPKPSGEIRGDEICESEQAQLTFTSGNSTGPFTITYTDGINTYTQTNVQNTVPFNLPFSLFLTTTYTLVSVKDDQRCAETNFQVNDQATVIVNHCIVECNKWLNVPSQGSKVEIGDLDVTGNQITVEARFNRTQPLNGGVFYGNLVSKHTFMGDCNYSLLPNGCEITTTGGGYKAIFQSCPLDLNTNYHVAMVYDGTTLKYYRDGFLLSQIPCTGNMIQNNLLTTIGQVAGGSNPTDNQFAGYINEVKIWNVARTQAQIRAYMNTPVPDPTTQPGLLAYYVFDNLNNDAGPANNGLGTSVSVNQNNTNCAFTPDSCQMPTTDVIADFDIPASVCVGEPVNITNTSQHATSYFWNFCQGNINNSPTGTNLGNPGNQLSTPVFMDYVFDNGNYYGFVTSYVTANLIRLDFGNSLLNTPNAVNLGNFGGVIPTYVEGIQVVKNQGKWYAIMVGGYPPVSTPQLLKLDFGANITNPTPLATSWGNLGNMLQPLDLHVFEDNGNWYGFTVNAENNTITRFNFTNSFDNTPTAVNLGNIGNLAYPSGIYAIKDNNDWKVFIANGGNRSQVNGVWSITRLDFGNSLLNTPTGVNLGNPGAVLKHPRDLTIMKFCGQIVGFAVNGAFGSDDVVKIDFNNDLNSTPVLTSLGNLGNMNFPPSITKIFRVGSDLYSFVCNANNNTITRLRFEGCTNSSIPNSTAQNPPPIVYNTPGIYSISLTVDDGLPTQMTVCKQIEVEDCSPTTVIPSFDIPASVCVGKPVTINNTSQGASSYFWSFCTGDPLAPPTAANLGTFAGISAPVFSDIVTVNGNYYVFVVNNWPGGLVRLDFGNSLLNNPTSVNLGTVGVIPNTAEGIQVVKDGSNWYAIIVGGDAAHGIPSRIVKIDFGTNITNPTPIGTDWGNIGNMAYPTDLHVFRENGKWYGFTVNAQNNTVTRFNFTNSFNNTPTAVNLGNIGNLNYPTGIYAININGNWYVFITNDSGNSLTRLDFGTSLLSTPTGVNLGSLGGIIKKPRDIYVMQDCDQLQALVVNGEGINQLIRLNFNNNITSVPTAVNLGNVGTLDFPHSISQLFRAGNDLYSFVTNVRNNTITRVRFAGCTNSSIPSSTAQNPPTITYNQPGTYNITLTVDEGLPTQSSFCKKILVETCDTAIINKYTEVLSLDKCTNTLTVANAADFNVGDTVLMIQMKGIVIDSTNTAAFGNITDIKNAGNYEFNYVKSKDGNNIELENAMLKEYDLPDGIVQLIRIPYFSNYTNTSTLTCLPWDGRKGGVLAFNVQNTLTLGKNIDVSGRGFLGGQAIRNSVYNCNIDSFWLARNNGSNGGMKGEGIYSTSGRISGRGRLANGGGGGNSTNSGGAGGGNAGFGGAGGDQYNGACGPNSNGGIGGMALTFSNVENKIFLGGGGGAGHMNDSPLGSGGNGGGIVIISAATIIADNYSINANGNAPVHVVIPNDDGRSGGGAGGAVLLNYTNIVGDLTVRARGGSGDTCDASFPARQHGPGGGGGGGVGWVSQPAIVPNLVIDLNGGASGVNRNYANDPWGAMMGNAGLIVPRLALPITTVPFKKNIDSVRMTVTRQTCLSFHSIGVEYVNISPVVNWEWFYSPHGSYANSQSTTHVFPGEGEYEIKLVGTDINGCKDSVSQAVTIGMFDFDFSYMQNACNPLDMTFRSFGDVFTTPYWNTGTPGGFTPQPGQPGIIHQTYPAFGDYVVTYAVGDGYCSDTIRKTININVIRDSLIITNDTTICAGTTKQLRSLAENEFCWSPVTYLNDPALVNPVTSTPGDITYHLISRKHGTNLVVNGNFTQGNTGFTSDYTFKAPPNNSPKEYFTGPNPRAWNPTLNNCTDKTTGNGNMLMFNGANQAGLVLWKQTVTVMPNTNYTFSTWLQSLGVPIPADIRFAINGKYFGNTFTAPTNFCQWIRREELWNSGNNTTVEISIIEYTAGGQSSSFAFDDISFAETFIIRDSVNIRVNQPLVRTSADNIICAGDSLQLNTTGAVSYQWLPSAGLSDPNIANPKASPVGLTRYIVTGTNANGCEAKDTVFVNLHPTATITKIANTEICKNTAIQIWAAGGQRYEWTPGMTLNDPALPNPTATPSQLTTYYVTIWDANSCDYSDSVKVSIRPDPVFTINAPREICEKDSVQLKAAGGDTYTWQPSVEFTDAGDDNPRVSPGTTTDFTVTITENVCDISTTLSTRITVNPLPDVQATSTRNLDCSYDRSQLNVTGANRYIWNADPSLSNIRISNPVASPKVPTTYVVRGYDLKGCWNTDTLLVDITQGNKGNYLIPNAFTPNGDGLNDCFGIKFWGVVYELKLNIYNRWGTLIWSTSDPNACWDGTFKGVMQGPDVFVYIVTAKTNCEPHVFRKGTFTLIR